MRASIYKLVLTASAVALAACGSDRTITAPPPPPPSVLLKDIVINRLPSPYYHFDYDADHRVSGATFASGLASYAIVYDGGRISEMRDNTNILGNQVRLVYVYDDAGRVASVKYTDDSGVFTVLFFTYTGQQLTKLERDSRVTGGFIIDKTMSFSYYPDGNLFELTEHRPAIEGFQPEATTVDRFEGYDDKINVDAFDLIHDDFFDHLVLLPGVQLQKGNPTHISHTGDGDNYTVDYDYTYDSSNRPLTKGGELVFLTGQDAGQHFPLSTTFSYYD
jgi:hypothetical protein